MTRKVGLKMVTAVQSSTSSKIIPFPTRPKQNKRKAVSAVKPNEPVQPIKDVEDIKAAKEYLRNKPRTPENLRNYMMFVININNAARISDLFKLTIGDVLEENGEIVDEVYIRESKTSKTRYMFFGTASKEAIREYLNSLKNFSLDDPLFASRKKDKDGRPKPLTRQQAWNIMHDMGEAISTEKKKLHLGTHSMRKTFGYQRIKMNKNDPMIVAEVSEMYNHESMNTTYRYLGIDTETKRKLCIETEL